MEYPANMLDPTKGSDEKASFGNVGVLTTGRAGITSQATANVTHFISEKLLEWGVEERGAYRIFNFLRSIDSGIMNVFLYVFFSPVNSLGIRPVAVEDRTETNFIKTFFVFLTACLNISS